MQCNYLLGLTLSVLEVLASKTVCPRGALHANMSVPGGLQTKNLFVLG